MAQRDAEFARDGLLEPLDRFVLEFDDPAAALADEMVVMMLTGDFVARLAFVEVPLIDQVAFLQQAQRTVDGSVADVRIDLLALSVEFLGTDMAVEREEDARDVIALAGRLEPALLQPRVKLRHPLLGLDGRRIACGRAGGAFFQAWHGRAMGSALLDLCGLAGLVGLVLQKPPGGGREIK